VVLPSIVIVKVWLAAGAVLLNPVTLSAVMGSICVLSSMFVPVMTKPLKSNDSPTLYCSFVAGAVIAMLFSSTLVIAIV